AAEGVCLVAAGAVAGPRLVRAEEVLARALVVDEAGGARADARARDARALLVLGPGARVVAASAMSRVRLHVDASAVAERLCLEPAWPAASARPWAWT